MQVSAKFLAARAAEHRHRLLTHLGRSEPLLLPLLRPAGRAFLVPQVQLTERHRLELELSENAFVVGRAPLLGDVFNALWRLHPEFARPLPGRVHAVRDLGRRRARFFRLWFAFGSLRAARLHRWLSRQVARCDLFAASAAIRERFALAEQDALATDLLSARSPFSPPICRYDDLVDFLSSTYAIAPAAVLDLPRALVHQLYRNRLLSAPDGDVNVIDPSDELICT